MNKKTLVLTPILPYPPDDGSRLRPYQIIKALYKLADIELVSFYLPNEDINSAKEFYKSYCKNLYFLEQKENKNFFPQFCVYHSNRENKKLINKIIQENNYDLIVVEKIIMLSYLEKKVFKNYKVVIDSWGIDSEISRQLYKDEKNLFKKFILFIKYIRHFFCELCYLSKCKYFVAITDKQFNFYKKFFKRKKLFLIPNFVDTDYFKPNYENFEEKTIVFTGIMNFLPNIDAVMFFVNKVMPKLKEKTNVKFYIVGKNPTKEVLMLHNNSDIIVTGEVKDIREYISKAEVVVVPLWIGSGLRNKVLHAMACGKTVVATREAVEGINVKDKENILIANTPQEFVEKILLVLNNKELNLKIAKNARKFIEENFSEKVIEKKWINMYEEIFSNNNNS
jgi:glycosyltransferase involved in cell wall biosynthesis